MVYRVIIEGGIIYNIQSNRYLLVEDDFVFRASRFGAKTHISQKNVCLHVEGRLLTGNFVFLTICVFVSFVRTLSDYAAQLCFLQHSCVSCSPAVIYAAQPCIYAAQPCIYAAKPCFHGAQPCFHCSTVAYSCSRVASPCSTAAFHAAEVALTGHRTFCMLGMQL